MTWWEDVQAYYKDNPEGYWFKARLYGWGWTPVRWQGWLVLVLCIGALIGNAIRIDSTQHSVSDVLVNVIPQSAVLVLVLLLTCYFTGEKPRWMWGPPRRK